MYKVTVYKKKKQNKILETHMHRALKRARHHAKIAFASGYPVRIDKIIMKKKKKKK